jgi:hypothetical protein
LYEKYASLGGDSRALNSGFGRRHGGGIGKPISAGKIRLVFFRLVI